jgi:3-oxoadipate enol-lactonase
MRKMSLSIRTKTIATRYELGGDATRSVVMLSHSLGSGMSMWDEQLAALHPGFRVLRYDTRGHGGSEAPPAPYRLDELVEDAVALLDALEIPNVHFVGLSMGGMIGQGLALSHPHRLLSLCLCSTAAVMPELAQPAIQERIDTARSEGMQGLVEGTLARWFTPGFLRKHASGVERIRRQFLATPAAGYVGCTEAIRRLNYLDQLQRIDLPTLVVVGQDDPGTPVSASQAIHERIRGSRMEVVPEAMHLVNVEQSEIFNRTLVGFLKGVAPAAP